MELYCILALVLPVLIVQSRREPYGNLETPPFGAGKPYLCRLNAATGKVSGGQFYWGGTLPKSNARVQRLASHGWTSCFEV